MAKSKAASCDHVAGAYPPLPQTPHEVGPKAARAWGRWRVAVDAAVDFHHLEHWRYPSIPYSSARPSEAEDGATVLESQFDWAQWFSGIGPWLDARLDDALSKGRVDRGTAAAISDAKTLWGWISTETRHGVKQTDLLCRFSLQLGRTLEEIYTRSLDKAIKSGRRVPAISAKGGRASARLNAAEKDLVLAYIRGRISKGANAKTACMDATRQLLTGKFPKIKRRVERISTSTLQRYWSNRNAQR